MVSCTAIKATANLSHSLNPTNCRVIPGRNVFHFMCSKLIQKHSWSNLFCIIRIVLATLSMAPYPSLSERSARLQDSSSQLFEPLQFTDCGSADSFIERLLPSCHRQSHFLSHYQQFLPPLAKETLCHSKAKSTAKQSSLQACAVSQSSLYISFIYSCMVMIWSYSWIAPLHAAVGQVPQGFAGIALATFQPGQHFTQLAYPACLPVDIWSLALLASSLPSVCFCMVCRLPSLLVSLDIFWHLSSHPFRSLLVSTNLFLVWQLQERWTCRRCSIVLQGRQRHKRADKDTVSDRRASKWLGLL